MKNKAHTQYCRTLGSLAFAIGIPCTPGLDPLLMAHMTGRQVGDPMTQPEFVAWYQGWHQANLAGEVVA